MAQREPRPDPRFQKRPVPPPAARPPGASAARPSDPGDFLGLGMELEAGARRAAARTPPPPVDPLSTLPPPLAMRAQPPPTGSIPPPPTPRSHHPARDAASPSNATPRRPSPPAQSGPSWPRAQPHPTGAQAQQAAQSLPPSAGHAAQPAPRTHPNQRIPPAPQPAPTSMASLMRPMPFETLPPRYEEPAVRTNSWLLNLDDANSGLAGDEPVVPDPGQMQRRPRVARPLDTSFTEHAPAARRSGPLLVGLLLAAAASSLVFVFGSTLTKVDPAKLTRSEPPVKPHVRPLASEGELTDPLDAPVMTTHSPTAHLKNASKVAGAVTSTLPARSKSATPAPTSARPRPLPIEEPQSSAPQRDVFELPDPNASAVPDSPVKSGADDTQPASSDGSSITPPPPSASWWPGALRATPLATHESCPAPDEMAASRERQARVGQWLMVHSRGAAPRADASAEFVPPGSEGADQDEPAAAAAVTASADKGGRARASMSSSPSVPSIPITGRRDEPNVAAAGASDVLARATTSASGAQPVEADATPASSDDDAGSPPTAILWEGTTVPADRIGSNVRVLTPQVGRVRAGLRNGGAIEGRLYAVGGGRVWIDADVGRIALPRSELARLEQLASPVVEPEGNAAQTDITTLADADAATTQGAAPAAPAKSAAPVVKVAAPIVEPPPRVRVRTPGGVFYGQVVGREGASITLLTDEGSRIVLESDDIEAAPLNKAVVKRGPAAQTSSEKPAGKSPEKTVQKSAETPPVAAGTSPDPAPDPAPGSDPAPQRL